MHIQDRMEFGRFMREKGIYVTVNNRRNDRYTIFGGERDDLPNTARADADTILLPMHGDLTDQDVDKIIAAVKEFDLI